MLSLLCAFVSANMFCILLYMCILMPYAINAGNHEIYRGYSVHGVNIRHSSDVKFLSKLEIELNLDIWQYGAPEARNAKVMVSPEKRIEFFDKLEEHGMSHYVYLPNVTKALEDHDAAIRRWKISRTNRIFPFENFPTYAEVDDYIERIARENPDIVTLVNAGPSFEGRGIKYLKISTTNFTDSSKPVYFLDAMIHAREWVTTPVALYTIHRLVEDLKSEDIDLLQNTDWIILPIVNPDGYDFSHTNDRLWRRTRSFRPEISSTCYGVDGNRNFDYAFGTVGVSTDPCAQRYAGPEPFSEIETRYVRDILHEHIDRIQVYLNMHSYGNWVLFPFGNGTLPENLPQLHHISSIMGAAIDAEKTSETPFYTVGNANLLLYGTSGSADDYSQYIGVPFSICLELPDFGFDFRVPPEYIEQINAETWQGIAATARAAYIYYRVRN